MEEVLKGEDSMRLRVTTYCLALSIILIAGCSNNTTNSTVTPSTHETPTSQEQDINNTILVGQNVIEGPWISFLLDNKQWWKLSYDEFKRQITTYSTVDSGNNWLMRGTTTVGYGDGGIDLQFTDATHGFLTSRSAGNCTLKMDLHVTTDQGDQWKSKGDLPFGGVVVFSDSNTGWLSGGPRGGCNANEDTSTIWFYTTTNGGDSWSPVKMEIPPQVASSRQISSMRPHFFDRQAGVMSVYFQEFNISYIYRTSDGGKHWITVGHVEGFDPQFTDALHGTVTDNGVEKWTTEDGGILWMNATLTPPVDATAQLVSAYSDSASNGWFVYKETSGLLNQLHIYHSPDQGVTWNESILPVKESWENEMPRENLFVSLHSEQESMPSWILLSSEPALGQMVKRIYRTADDGKSWTYVGDVSRNVDGYVTGISFRDEMNGWISATYHSVDMIPLYRTEDGGKSWKLQKIDLPPEFSYGNAYAPTFDPTDSMKGTLKIEFVNEKQRVMTEYATTDGGETWVVK
jgi:photosystem II stability/assembly factor-like uncharacterized protein